MAKRILILVDKIGPKSEVFGKGTNAQVACFTDLLFDINSGDFQILVNDVNISEFGLVYIRRADHSHFSLAGSLALCLDKLGITYFDRNFSEIGAAGDKLTSYLKLSIAEIPVPHTIFCMGGSIKRYEDYIINELGFPIVAKELVGQHMTGIYAISSKKQFEELPKKIGEKNRTAKYLFQKYIPLESEYRLLVLGDRVKVVHTKIPRDYSQLKLNYFNQNQCEEYLKVDSISRERQEIAVKAAKCLNIQIAGVDLAIEKETGKAFIFEVNRGPGFNYDIVVSPEIREVSEFLKNVNELSDS
jgi:glutathione synthase/RimK-type ligase-like ATP-grasp enzyme